MKRVIIKLLIFVFLTGIVLSHIACVSTPKMANDTGISSISAGYPSAEFHVGDQIFLGLGQTEVLEGSLFDDLEIYVQGYMNGTIHIDSERCGIHWSGAYQGSEKVRVPLTGVARESCIIDVGVFPEFFSPGEQGEQVTEGMSGSFLVKVSKPSGPPQLLMSSKVPADSNVLQDIVLEDPELDSIQGLFGGCGKEPSVRNFAVNESNVELSLSRIVGPLTKVQSCVLEGGIKSAKVKKRVSWQVAVYKPTFVPLAVPNISEFMGKAKVTADPETALILVNDEITYGPRAEFEVIPGKKYVVRSISMKGRASICALNNGGKGWSCQQ